MDQKVLNSRIGLFARFARRRLRRWGALIRWGRFSLNGIPILFANSFPKSGTHLLTQVLQGFTRLGPAVNSGLPAIVTFEGDTGRRRASREIVREIKRLLPGDIAYGHVHALPGAIETLCQDGIATYFILRDPRDVVVSHVHYVTEMEPTHIHHRYYTEELGDFDERLNASILGRPDLDIPFPDILGRFEPYMNWLDHPEVLLLRFEEFILNRDEAIGRVLDHALKRGFPVKMERARAIRVLSENIDPDRSPTFRSGKVGGWKAKFTDEHKHLFKETVGDLLVRLGYEQDNDW
jgi:hypothetical protein